MSKSGLCLHINNVRTIERSTGCFDFAELTIHTSQNIILVNVKFEVLSDHNSFIAERPLWPSPRIIQITIKTERLTAMELRSQSEIVMSRLSVWMPNSSATNGLH
ncbi:unnamed protein product [Hermetia illucens]|uniref:Uncharacterized protein n=1 Tax=Hermetia illucens TaxID=343691 RepID=A0A7R8V4D7_HERIL|nr:unnamed protein product [Hermetia illucens]